jgi:hypothetical protein
MNRIEKIKKQMEKDAKIHANGRYTSEERHSITNVNVNVNREVAEKIVDDVELIVERAMMDMLE